MTLEGREKKKRKVYQYIHDKHFSRQRGKNREQGGFVLKVLAQSFDLLDEKVDILEGGGRIGDHHAEKVDLVPLWLVADHGRAVLHHPGFYHGGHLGVTLVIQQTHLITLQWITFYPAIKLQLKPVIF